MQLSTIRDDISPTATRAVLVDPTRGVADVAAVIGHAHPDAGSVIRHGISADRLADALASCLTDRFEDPAQVTLLAPIQQPGMIWGIGPTTARTRRTSASRLRRRSPRPSSREPTRSSVRATWPFEAAWRGGDAGGDLHAGTSTEPPSGVTNTSSDSLTTPEPPWRQDVVC